MGFWLKRRTIFVFFRFNLCSLPPLHCFFGGFFCLNLNIANDKFCLFFSCSNSSSREGITNIHNASSSSNSANNSKSKKIPKRKRVSNYQFDNNGGSGNSSISANAIQKLNKQAQSQQQQAQSNTNASNNLGKTLKMGASSR